MILSLVLSRSSFGRMISATLPTRSSHQGGVPMGAGPRWNHAQAGGHRLMHQIIT